ncbi:hypothetical protein N7U66_07550 [Lacinutrix neustonica]|uniref:Uncharacterized protein n=1 Tax=Lacinutrix neustonica TaxID=2980107 RepID=A0A9E8SEB5_9FLAO|nr:hypothetical protein [Lacinutrix neustonica]WAC03378.1 hypothetical protein N7U66_07550 [Lacinutrix neustonica]
MKWSKYPNRIKIFGIWFVLNFALWVLFGMAIPEQTFEEKIAASKEHLNTGNYKLAKSGLSKIKPTDTGYKEAQYLIIKADSLITMEKEQKLLAKEAAKKKARETNEIEQKKQLEREIAAITEGVDFSSYKGSVDALQMELILFGAWAKIIEDGEKYEAPEIRKLAKTLKNKVVNLQVREFPKMRKEYAKIMADKLWSNDINVYSSGFGSTYINLTGGIFAANKNKKDFQNQIRESLKMYRFKQARYRWYKGDDEYTYWSLEPEKDTQLVTFK